MKQVTGSAIGILALGVLLIAFGLFRGSEARGGGVAQPAGAAAAAAPAMPVAFGSPSRDLQGVASGAQETASGGVAGAAGNATLVNCEPGQRALVRQGVFNGEPVSQVDCVTDPAFAGVSPVYGRPVSDARVVPAVGTYSVAQPQVTYHRAARRTVARRGSSWKKPLMVIGGSAAAGAGIGGLIGGGKGALIGAALGGGAGTLYEAARR